ncbi:hypothetical protein [Oceaniovalibus sp. ACAM 378]|uniref:hypothetical protein n=1 Tax=Oceaniovalibus sp. ACAM 378 TaxID=2599923 RepID=UPI0011D5D6A9|nr:hypothetical protein [Oceaniovalibus sp. ACAM 378]TYB85206.1 hypothetical protein FQ320_19875 [Oceaniovalibus sp. ACAM 378]
MRGQQWVGRAIIGRVTLVAFFLPRDLQMEQGRGLAGNGAAVILINPRPVVAARALKAACNAVEKMDTARRALLTRRMSLRAFSRYQIHLRVSRIRWGVDA